LLGYSTYIAVPSAFYILTHPAIHIVSTYETAEKQFVTVGGVKYAYRLFGKQEGIPLFMHIHFRGNMD
jgi:hypothetical protein